MAFYEYEESRRRGEPIELYNFEFGQAPEDRYCYTNFTKTIVFNNIPYKPIPISRGDIQSDGTLDKLGIEIYMSGYEEIPEVFRIFPPSYVMSLIVFQGHVNDPLQQFSAIWAGRVMNSIREGSEVTITGEPVQTMFNRSGLRRNYQRPCPHVLYGDKCRAKKIPYRKTVSAIYVRNVITVTPFTEDPLKFQNGFLEYVSAKGRRQIYTIISAGSDGNLKLFGQPIDMAENQEVTLFMSCDHTQGPYGCALHDNILNYGGQVSIPLKNPTNSTSVFS